MDKRFQFILSGIILVMILTGALLFTIIVEGYVYRELVKQTITDNKVIAFSVTKSIDQQIENNSNFENLKSRLQASSDLLNLPNDGYICAIDNKGKLIAYPNNRDEEIHYINEQTFTSFKPEQKVSFDNFYQTSIFEGFYGNDALAKRDILVAVSHPQTGIKVLIHQNNGLIRAKAGTHFSKLMVLGGIVAVVISIITFIISNQQVKLFNDKINQKNNELNEAFKSVAEHNTVLQYKTEELVKLNDEKEGIVEIVAHDLKSPLHRVKGLLGLLRLTGPVNADQNEQLTMITTEIFNQESLINDILEVNKIETKNQQVNIESIDINAFVLALKKDYEESAHNKLQKFNLILPKQSFTIATDKIILQRILDNLMSNAVKYTEKEKAITLDIEKGTDVLIIKVIDEGQGFNKEDKANMFKKFQKLTAQPTNNESSNGLGLYIVKNLINRLNGSIEVISNQDVGTTFEVRIPL